MGLIYVNPEGPNGNPDPLAAARDIRETFRRMAMNDEETVALIAGGHTFGKTHGAADADQYVGPAPEGASLEEQGPRLEEQLWQRQGRRHDHQRVGRCLDHRAGELGQQLLRQLVRLRVGAGQESCRCDAVDPHRCIGAGHRARCSRSVEEARPHHANNRPLTEDGPDLRADFKALPREPGEFADAFAKAWYKLTHRDMGPRTRCLGPLVPAEPQLWQDPVPDVTHE